MVEAFIPLAAFVRRTSVPSDRDVAVYVAPTDDTDGLPAAQSSSSATSNDSAAPCDVGAARALIGGELALMRLAAREAFERAGRTLLALLASDVLGRELALAPVDVEALVARTLATFSDLEPVRLALSETDAARIDATRVAAALPVRADAALDAGDFVIEVRDGALESYRPLRVQAVLARTHAAMLT